MEEPKMSEVMIKGFEEENIKCSKFTEKIGNNYIDYKFEYENNQRIIDKQQKVIDKMSKFIINVIDNDDAFYYLGNGELLSTSEDVKNYFTKEIENEEEN